MRASVFLVFATVLFFAGNAPAQLFERTPGTVISIDLASLPRPYDPPSTIPKPARAMPTVLPGFAVNVFASGLSDARNLKVAPDGTVFLSEPRINQITLLRGH